VTERGKREFSSKLSFADYLFYNAPEITQILAFR